MENASSVISFAVIAFKVPLLAHSAMAPQYSLVRTAPFRQVAVMGSLIPMKYATMGTKMAMMDAV